MLALLGLLPFFALLYVLLQQERQLGPRHSRVGLVAAARRPGSRRYVPPAFFLTALVILVVALARPQTVIGQAQRHGTVILAFDVSASMAATDNAPTRLEAAKAAARALVLQRPEEVSIGIVAFSNTGLAELAPTDDQAAILAVIDRLAPQRGTALGQGILAALGSLSAVLPTQAAAPNSAPGVIVLFSDGENKLNPEPLEAALAATQMGVRIFPVGFGSLKGARLALDGVIVHTQLEEEALRNIALVTGGDYFNGSLQPDLKAVYQGVATQMVTEATHVELTSLFVGAALVVLMLGAVFSLFWFGRLP